MAAMDLQCRLDHGEGRWGQDEAKLLERFDAERKEWESQLRDMQKNIEELYNEVKARREGNTTGLDSKTQDSFPPNFEKNVQPAPSNHPCNGYFHPPNHHSNGINNPMDHHGNPFNTALPDHHSNGGYDPVGCQSNGYSYHNHHSNGGSHPADHYSNGRRDSAEVELEDILNSCLGPGLKHVPSSCGQTASLRATDGCQGVEHSQPRPACDGDERQKCTGVVNSALKDIARVSEDLCSYQNAIRKKSSDTRSEADSPWFEEVENVKNKQPDWMSQRGDNSWETASRGSNKADGVKPSSGKPEAPPIPPRTTSSYMNSSNSPEPQFPVRESFTNRKCHSPCVLTDRKCTSPSVLRKFEAMLQENEGKTLTDSGVVTNIVPAESKCNTGSFHCRVGNTKSSAFVPVQKWHPEASTLPAEIDCRADCRPADSQKFPRGHFQPMDREPVGKSMPTDFRSSPKGPWRSPAMAKKGVGQGFEGENVSEMGVRPRGVNSYSPVQSVDNNVGSTWESRFQAVNEKPFRPTAPASQAQSPDFWYSCRGEEPNLRGYECSDRFQQGQKLALNGSGQHEDLIELLGMLGIEHQYDTAKTHPQTPCQQESPQENQKSSVSVKKAFSRPARPANRRPPSRWANRVPSAPVTHVTPFPDPPHKQTLSPYSYQIETVIM
ncbi:uncharacterized protein LOC118228776 [Anguilla anguilla]|uniref:uncharacterized protein LOC118228776 n=1 Tax=Anguilla anguilla TaxID=7936 RepID=UPI0015AE3FA9|nr:uncharacterized protein LOC118228776 [Anguilla anguilla]XP_035276080.1 uncharacterized protein LOC118228776 [Anguilla anguilla]